MIKIRLSRTGVRKNPFYRIVVCDERVKNKGKHLEIIGFWHPAKNLVKIDKGKLAKWEKTGAKTTPAVSRLITDN